MKTRSELESMLNLMNTGGFIDRFTQLYTAIENAPLLNGNFFVLSGRDGSQRFSTLILGKGVNGRLRPEFLEPKSHASSQSYCSHYRKVLSLDEFYTKKGQRKANHFIERRVLESDISNIIRSSFPVVMQVHFYPFDYLSRSGFYGVDIACLDAVDSFNHENGHNVRPALLVSRMHFHKSRPRAKHLRLKLIRRGDRGKYCGAFIAGEEKLIKTHADIDELSSEVSLSYTFLNIDYDSATKKFAESRF